MGVEYDEEVAITLQRVIDDVSAREKAWAKEHGKINRVNETKTTLIMVTSRSNIISFNIQ